MSSEETDFLTPQSSFLIYQLAFLTPGIIPESARSRKQIRQSPNFRKYARERPQR